MACACWALLPSAAAAAAAAPLQAISHLWLAVLQYDWGGRAVRRAPPPGAAPPSSELQQLLSNPHVKVGSGWLVG